MTEVPNDRNRGVWNILILGFGSGTVRDHASHGARVADFDIRISCLSL
jgi:hypothetical protein